MMEENVVLSNNIFIRHKARACQMKSGSAVLSPAGTVENSLHRAVTFLHQMPNEGRQPVGKLLQGVGISLVDVKGVDAL